MEYGLGRIPQFDEASRNFPIRTLVADKPLRSYTWSVNTWLDQDGEGACVGFAYAHELVARPFIIRQTNQDARELYFEIQRNDPWPGGAYPGADPVYEGTSVLSGAQVLKNKGYYSQYRWAFRESDIALAIGYRGPVVLGINWYEGMFRPDQDGFIHPTGNIAGGHAILAHSFSLKGGYYWLWNSWGKRWGMRWGMTGRARISRSDVTRLMQEEGEGCLPIRVGAKI